MPPPNRAARRPDAAGAQVGAEGLSQAFEADATGRSIAAWLRPDDRRARLGDRGHHPARPVPPGHLGRACPARQAEAGGERDVCAGAAVTLECGDFSPHFVWTWLCVTVYQFASMEQALREPGLFYDRRDLSDAIRLGDHRLDWVAGLGGRPIQEADIGVAGFLFGYQVRAEDYRDLLQRHEYVRDRPEEREELRHLDHVLKQLDAAGVNVPLPESWVLRIDDLIPRDITYPVFVRTSVSSWKRGGQISRVKNLRQLEEEAGLLRRAFQWDATIIARQWLDLASSGTWRYGTVPQEIRVWIVDQEPAAWSFHYLNAVQKPKGFPPSEEDLRTLARYAAEIGPLFRSRLIAADFARANRGSGTSLKQALAPARVLPTKPSSRQWRGR